MKTCQKMVVGGFLLLSLLGVFGLNKSESSLTKEKRTLPNKTATLIDRIEKNKYFDNGQIFSQKTYLHGKLITERFWNTEGDQTYEFEYSYSENETIYEKTYYSIDPLCQYIEGKERYRGFPEGQHTLLRKWFYDKKTHRLLSSEYYREGTKIADRTDVYDDEGELKKTFFYYYIHGKEKLNVLKGFDCYNAKGDRIGSYTTDTSMDIEKIISNRNVDLKQIEEWLHVYQNDKRTPVVIIDTGFDISHSLLSHKLWKNPKEVLNGKDDDGDGFIDNINGGWNRFNLSKLDFISVDPLEFKKIEFDMDSPNINEFLRLEKGEPPVSHGTHVASIALKNLDEFALVGFAGDFSDPGYLSKISRFLKEHDIRFVNMSFGLDSPEDFSASGEESVYALKQLISSNPQTLFFIAAGNNYGLDLDKKPVYPASVLSENTIVFGALNTDDIIESELPNYKIADFSNTGRKTLDIFAPGTKIQGAMIGGGNINLSGTSIATPYGLNCAMEISKKNPNLTTSDIKEIILKTAYVKDPNNPLPCVSGGILYPKRAYSVA